MSIRSKVGLVVVLVLAMLGLIYAVHLVSDNATHSLKETSHNACIGSARRTAFEIGIFDTIYEADASSGSTPGISASQRQIRAAEADRIFQGMAAMVSVRVDVAYASLYPKALRPVIVRAGFRCPAA